MDTKASPEAVRMARNEGIPPKVIVTDNGSAFVNLKGRKLTAFQQARSEFHIHHRRIPFGHPQSIGRIERFHRTLREEEISLHRYPNPEEARRALGQPWKDAVAKGITRALGTLNLLIAIRGGNKKSLLEGRNFSAVSRETAGNPKS